jgi:C-terminal processing protease CtpA/Prc
VACIIDAGCVSAGETFARDLVQSVNARLIGETTAGASSAKEPWDFPSGIATLTIPTRSRFGPDRRPIEFFGIKPHEDVECVPEEVRSGKNSEILRAEEYLAKAGGKS